MSAKLYGLVWKAQLSRPSAKLVLARLAENAREDGTNIYPAVSTVARHTALSRRTVQYALEGLQLAGLIEQVRAGGGRKKAAQYRINVARLQAVADSRETVQILHPLGAGKGCKRQREMVQPGTKKGATVAPKPLRTLKEPSTASASAAAPDGAASAWPPDHLVGNADCGCAWCAERSERKRQELLAGLARPDMQQMSDDELTEPLPTRFDGPRRRSGEPALIHMRAGVVFFRVSLPPDVRRSEDDRLERSLGTSDLDEGWQLRDPALKLAEAYIARLRAGVDRATADQWLALAFSTLRRVTQPPTSAIQLALPGLEDDAPADIEELMA